MNERGHTFVELLLVVAILGALFGFGLPHIKAYSVEAHIAGASRLFKDEFLKAHSTAVKTGVTTALRFEQGAGGQPQFSVYQDGNDNGVLSADIRAGRDRRIAGPFLLHGGAPGVRVGILPDVPAIPPERGTLDPARPIRFGSSGIVTFTPLGTATPGTFYLAGSGVQAAVRVNGTSGRVRLMFLRGRKWVER